MDGHGTIAVYDVPNAPPFIRSIHQDQSS